MPNHCSNTLTVTGPSGSVARFIERITADRGDDASGLAGSYLPFPPALHGRPLLDPRGRITGYAATDEGRRWALKHWGTKWGDYDLDVGDVVTHGEQAEATIRFTTAWGPMIEGLVGISGIERDLTFILDYREDANAVLGSAGMRQGCLEAHIDYELDDLPDLDDEDPDGYEAYDEAVGTLLADAHLKVAEALDPPR